MNLIICESKKLIVWDVFCKQLIHFSIIRREKTMRQLFEEYGGPIIAAIAIIVLIGIVFFLQPTIKGLFKKTTDNFSNQVTTQQQKAQDQSDKTDDTTNP